MFARRFDLLDLLDCHLSPQHRLADRSVDRLRQFIGLREPRVLLVDRFIDALVVLAEGGRAAVGGRRRARAAIGLARLARRVHAIRWAERVAGRRSIRRARLIRSSGRSRFGHFARCRLEMSIRCWQGTFGLRVIRERLIGRLMRRFGDRTIG